MRNKVLRLTAKEVIKDNKKTVYKTFFITMILMAILFVILNPIVKIFLDTLMKYFKLKKGLYIGYGQTLNIMSLGFSLMIVSVFSDFILCSLSLDLIRNKPFNKESIISRFNSIGKYIMTKIISISIQSVWYGILNLLRKIISTIFMILGLRLFGQLMSKDGEHFYAIFYFLIFIVVFLVFFMFSVNIIIYSRTFVLSFIALDTENDFKKRDIFKIYKAVMKRNKIKSFNLLLGFIPGNLLLIIGVIIFYYAFNAVANTTILLLLGLVALIIIRLYPRIMITLALAYERMYNYSK